MIKKRVTDIASEMGIRLSRITVVEGTPLGCLDAYLLNMSKDGQVVSALIYKSELDDINNNVCDDRLEIKLRSALLRLKMVLAP